MFLLHRLNNPISSYTVTIIYHLEFPYFFNIHLS